MRLLIKKGTLAGVICFVLCLAVAGCSPSEAAESDRDSAGQSSEEAVVSTWSPDIDCGTCHEAETATSKDAACLAGAHTVDQGFGCMTCHADDGALSAAHADMNSGKTPKKLKRTEVDQDLCFGCHIQDELMAATADSIVLTDDYGKTVNPHAIPENADHAEDVLCTSCHKGHSTEGIEEDSKDLCVGCHHANVYECGTCHEE